MRKIKVMADYQCYPLWDMSPGKYGDIDPHTLPISDDLKHKFVKWARAFDDTLDTTNPVNSGFKSEEAEAAFKAEGIRLAEQLQDELGSDFSVSVNVGQ